MDWIFGTYRVQPENGLTDIIIGIDTFRGSAQCTRLPRLVPIFPLNLLNYALGLTNIQLSHYINTSFIFMAPSGAAYTYLGYAGREVAAGGKDFIKKVLLAIAAIATIGFFSRVWMRMRRNRVDLQ